MGHDNFPDTGSLLTEARKPHYLVAGGSIKKTSGVNCAMIPRVKIQFENKSVLLLNSSLLKPGLITRMYMSIECSDCAGA